VKPETKEQLNLQLLFGFRFHVSGFWFLVSGFHGFI